VSCPRLDARNERPRTKAFNKSGSQPVLFRRKSVRFCFVMAAAAALLVVSHRPSSAEATLLIDGNTGKVIAAENATQQWYPASLTKLMTLYVTLRALKEHRISLDTMFTVSENAVAQPPAKMGFKAGTQLTVDNTIKMLMVKSANDLAVVLAEGVGGSIEGFSDEMNASAQRLGMTQTSYVNPNGLPADGQISSARDIAILARALIREYPEYESYWHISSMKFGRRVTRNYNPLIDRYPGADGMKTGFICASGFNLVASATQNGRKMIAVVLGAGSSAQRAQQAARLLDRGFASNTLSWLTPSLGNVENLVPVQAPPPNLRDETCGPHRKRPAAETDEVTAENENSGAMLLSSLRATSVPTYSLSGPPINPPPPLVVYVGPQRKPGEVIAEVDEPEPKAATHKKSAAKKQTAKQTAKKDATKPDAAAKTAAAKPNGKPANVTAVIDTKSGTVKPAAPAANAAKPKAAAAKPAAKKPAADKPKKPAPKSASAASAAQPIAR
jgi:D-alanyl-D-alanine carboxypeptidase